MENSYYSDNLELSFEIILSQKELKPYMQDICELIINKTISKERIEIILKEHNLHKTEVQGDFLDLILYYIELTLKDNLLTVKEKENILFLKRIFKIKERSFFKYKKQTIASILKAQLQRLYLNDLKVDNSEALYKVDLQEIFDLSYDEFIEFSNEVALYALERGAKIEDLDTYIKGYQENYQTRPPEKSSALNEKNEIWKKSAKRNEKGEKRIKKDSNFKTPNAIFWLEIIILSIFIYHESNNLLLAIGSFVLLAFLIHLNAIAFLLAIVMSFLVSKFSFDLIGIFFENNMQWIISIALFIVLLSKHYANDDLNTNTIRSRQIPSSVKKQVWERDNAKCVICGSIEGLEYDHDIPFSKGGSNSVNNIRLLCRSCNRSKKDKIE